ncbi:hypothetical protein GHT06_001872 [Daphnia sinensis]|uniref:T4 RNA ligase 1-like N-terminal domain-containing protein n=1 Tax=Daphnia sinensis TaxID=1820382 RepID=A0AAD5KEK5_9CRUS|nr:hypothetical protein GHT06_001872 [Daphnia sinensis]
MFKTINTINDILPQIKDKPEINVSSACGNNTTVVCYMFSGSDTFDNDAAIECRGITFATDTGNITSRPLHKFFNVGEKESTQIQNLKWEEVTRVMIKRDGSVIAGTNVGGKMAMKSKKAFDNKQAQDAMEYVNLFPIYQSFHEWCLSANVTPIYEWTAPDNRVVVMYDTASLVLLHVRDNVTVAMGIPMVEEVNDFEIQTYLQLAKTIEGIEGWVIQFSTGDMVKLKTQWYMDRHRIMTNVRTRDIAQAVIDETVDDLKAKLYSENLDASPIIEIEQDVVQKLNLIKDELSQITDTLGDMERKRNCTEVQQARNVWSDHGSCFRQAA